MTLKRHRCLLTIKTINENAILVNIYDGKLFELE